MNEDTNPLEKFVYEFTTKREMLERRTENLKQIAMNLLNGALARIASKRKIIREAQCEKRTLLKIECEAIIEGYEDDDFIYTFKGKIEGYDASVLVVKHKDIINDTHVLLVRLEVSENE